MKNQQFGAKADVWSLAMVMSEVLSGFSPFENVENLPVNQFDLVDLIIDEGLRPPLPSDTPEWLVALITSAWALDPEARFGLSFLSFLLFVSDDDEHNRPSSLKLLQDFEVYFMGEVVTKREGIEEEEGEGEEKGGVL